MLASRLVEMIEKHADELTQAVVGELETNPRTRSYHKLDAQANRGRVFDVVRNFGEWLDYKSDATTETLYKKLGQKRFHEAIPLAEVVYALMITKQQLRNFIRSQGLVDSAMELYQQIEIYNMVSRFFDRAVYFTVTGYEEEAALHGKPAGEREGTRTHSSRHN